MAELVSDRSRQAEPAKMDTAKEQLLQLARDSWDSPWRARRQILRILLAPVIKMRLRLTGVRLGEHGKFFGVPVVHRFRGSTIAFGKSVEIRSWQTSNVLGVAHRTILTTTSSEASIEIGDGVGLSGATICAAQRVVIGHGTLIGADVI